MKAYVPPVISVSKTDYVQIGGSQEYRLMATSHGRTAIAGERIFRSEPWPKIRFVHTFLEEAEKDAATLRAYLDALPAMRKTKKKSTDRSAYD